jgi:hypothetical protein
MKKVLLISLVLLLSLFSLNAFNVNSALVINSVTLNQASYDPGATVTGTISLNNTAATSVTVLLTSSTLTKGSDTITAPTITSIVLSANQNNAVQTFTLTVPAKPAGAYTAAITATDASNSANAATSPAYTLVVNPKAVLNLVPSDILVISTQPDQSRNKIFTIKNDGSVILTPTLTLPSNLTDNDNDKITLSATSLGTIAPGASSDVTLTASVSNDMDVDQYTGTIIVTDAVNSVTKTLPLKINVDPEICKDGRVSNKNPIESADQGYIKIDLKDPDNGDNFGPGSDIQISLNVENDKEDDIDVIVEAILYNMDQESEIEMVESDSISIDEDEDEDVDLTLKVPTSDSDLDEGDNFVLFVKAYEDGNEDENCNYDTVDLDFERNTNDVIINGVTISPQVASCSETVNFAVDVQNVGTREQDNVQVKLKETTLGLDLSSEIFSLKKFDKSGDSAIKTFTFKIPDNAKEGDYYVDAKVFFTSKSNSFSLNKLTVANCKAVVTSKDVLTLPQTSFTATQGKVFTVPLTLKNPGTQTATYTVDVLAENNWADVSAEQKVGVAGGEQITLYAYLTPKPSLAQGTYSATISVKQDDTLVKTASVTATVGSTSATTGGVVYQPSVTAESVWRNLAQSTAFWIAAIVIVFVLVIYVLSALLRPK